MLSMRRRRPLQKHPIHEQLGISLRHIQHLLSYLHDFFSYYTNGHRCRRCKNVKFLAKNCAAKLSTIHQLIATEEAPVSGHIASGSHACLLSCFVAICACFMQHDSSVKGSDFP